MKPNTFCSNGHLLTEETTYVYLTPSKKTFTRRCRVCMKAYNKTFREATPELQAAYGRKNGRAYRERHKEELRLKRAANSAERKRRYAANPEKNRREHLLRKYGITEDVVTELFDAQGGRCAICHIAIAARVQEAHQNDTAHIDHCHDTNKVRGLLCRLCNLGIGNLKDDPVRLRRAADYIERNR